MQKFVEKFFTISHDASASLIITLSTFILGYLITSTYFIISKYFERKHNRKLFIENLISLKKALKRQQTAFKDLAASLDITGDHVWVYDKVEFFSNRIF